MDRDTNYVAVGAFVLLVIGMTVSFVYWYTNQQEKRTYQRYEIYYEGTVSGLTVGSPVRYLGVDVGKVARVMLDPQHRKRVEVIAEIDAAAPIDARTLALLSLQGVTGLLFIDLEDDPKSTATGPLPMGNRYPMIRSAPSDLDVVLRSLPALASHAIELVDHLNQVVSDKNVRTFTATLESARLASERTPQLLEDIKGLVAELKRAAADVDLAAADFRSVTNAAGPDLKVAIANVRQITANLASTSQRLDQFIARTEPALSRFADQGLPELERLLHESRDTARDIRDLSRSLRQNPSRILYESNYHGVELPQ
ncbi:MAG TPA: MlaD family protein [Steroidobacteraceae bacterium]|nr:MlaD family protein [Steroidobacteraceae bacterium]